MCVGAHPGIGAQVYVVPGGGLVQPVECAQECVCMCVCTCPYIVLANVDVCKPLFQVLKQKRLYEGQREQLYQQQFNVEQTKFTVDNIKDTVGTVQAMQGAAKEMKSQFKKQKELDISFIDKMQVRPRLDAHCACINILAIFTCLAQTDERPLLMLTCYPHPWCACPCVELCVTLFKQSCSRSNPFCLSPGDGSTFHRCHAHARCKQV